MSVRIAVFDPLPLFRYGITAALRESGLGLDTPADLLAWIGTAQRQLVVLTLQTPADWTTLAQVHRVRPDVMIVAVLPDAAVAGYVRALTLGAVGVVARDCEPAELRDAVSAAIAGRTTMPIEVLHALTGMGGQVPVDDTPAQHELDWLRQLAAGVPVAALAETMHYSERVMFRLLRDLYTRMQVKGRTEALMRARERGWI